MQLLLWCLFAWFLSIKKMSEVFARSTSTPPPPAAVVDNNAPRYQSAVTVKTAGQTGEFLSTLQTSKSFKAGEVLVKIEGYTTGQPKRWSSVQYSESEHLEFNSELVYMNHSCDPSVIIDLDKMEIKALRDLNAGDDITFFYPSTEWDMAQSFKCWCGSSRCCAEIKGAKYLSKTHLDYFFNAHILRLLSQL